MILLINYYNDSHKKRQLEYDFCLKQNVYNPLIKAIIVFHDDSTKLPEIVKIISVKCNHRPTYQELFDYGNRFAGVKIIANLDIYFNETLENAKFIKLKEVYALCRWNYSKAGLQFYNSSCSQDVWIWRDKVKVVCNFGLGIPGCDNAIHNILVSDGYIVKSPSKLIQAIHLHNVPVRNYTPNDMLKLPYKYINEFQ